MKLKLFYTILLFCGILLSSCQKEENFTQSPNQSQESTEALVQSSNQNANQFENLAGKKAPVCNKIFLSTEYMTVSDADHYNLIDVLKNTGISLQGPSCIVFYHQTDANWDNRVDDAIDIQGWDDINGTVTFRINNLEHVCYGCLGGPPFCSYNNSTFHPTLGNGSCILGQFVLTTGTNQYVDIDLSTIFTGNCPLLC